MKKSLRREIAPTFTFPIFHSNHSEVRADQRGIKKTSIQVAMNYCTSFFKQGLIFHVVKNSLIPESLDPNIRKSIMNLVIIIAGDSGTILTCYKEKNAMRQIRKKSKVLKGFANIA